MRWIAPALLLVASCTYKWELPGGDVTGSDAGAEDANMGGSGAGGTAGAGAGGTGAANMGGTSGGGSGGTGGVGGSMGGSGGAGGSMGGSSGASTGGSGGQGGMTGGTAGMAGAATGGSGGAPVTQLYVADIAHCRSLTKATPGPTECTTASFLVDTGDAEGPTGGFVHFSLPTPPAGKSAISAELTLRTCGQSTCNSDKTGEVWQLSSFTLTSLESSLPALIGSSPLGADQGPVGTNTAVVWTLPASVLQGTDVYLGIQPTSNDAVRYVAAGAQGAPTLTVSYQ